jgi:hypothetical protein
MLAPAGKKSPPQPGEAGAGKFPAPLPTKGIANPRRGGGGGGGGFGGLGGGGLGFGGCMALASSNGRALTGAS